MFGPKELRKVLVEEDRVVIGRVEAAIEEEIMKYFDGETRVTVSMGERVNKRVQKRLEGRLTTGYDTWSAVTFNEEGTEITLSP